MYRNEGFKMSFGCIERCLIMSQTWAGLFFFCIRNVFFFPFRVWVLLLVVTFAIWGMGLYKRNVRSFEVSCYLPADPVMKALGNIRTTMTHNLHLNIHWTSLCLTFSLRWRFISIFVMMYSYNCNSKNLSFFGHICVI